MTIKAEAKKLEHDLGGDLADRVAELRPAQKQHIASFVKKHGFLESMQALYVNPAELEQCMLDCGYAQCGVCDEWFKPDEEMTGLFCLDCAKEAA